MPEFSWLLAPLAGLLVGFSLGLVGGGGSILAVPLLVYGVGVADPHVAVGTSAVAVAASAAGNLVAHARRGNVKWPCAGVFAAAGVAGAALGAQLGQRLDGQRLLFLFALLMTLVAALMLRKRGGEGDPKVRLGRNNFPRLGAAGLGTGLVSGFFGIGGGFLIVPGLVWSTGMPIATAMASSLVAVTAFGLTTASSYALAGKVDWPVAGLFILGGLAGGLGGGALAGRLARRKGVLNTLFASLILVVAGYMMVRSLGAL